MTKDNPTPNAQPPDTDNSDCPKADDLIRKLQIRLLSLAEEETLSAAEIERTAKAITQLITSIERAESFLRDRTDIVRPGYRLTGQARQDFLRRVKMFVERGGLDELEECGGGGDD